MYQYETVKAKQCTKQDFCHKSHAEAKQGGADEFNEDECAKDIL
jgi:hypothetical protein